MNQSESSCPIDMNSVQWTLTNALDALDLCGVPGTVAICLLPAGGYYIKAGGTATSTDGAAKTLYMGLIAFRDQALQQGQQDIATALTEAARAVARVLGEDRPACHEMH